MSVSNQNAKNLYVGNGVTRVWPYTFDLRDDDYLHVLVRVGEGELVELSSSSYTLDTDAKTVTYPIDGDALAAGSRIVLRRELPYVQGMDLGTTLDWDPEVIEETFDKLVFQIQQIAEALSRAVVEPADQDGAAAYQALLDAVAAAIAARDEAVAAVDGFDEHVSETEAAVIASVNALIAVAEGYAEQSCVCAESSHAWYDRINSLIIDDNLQGLLVLKDMVDGGTSVTVLTLTDDIDGGTSATVLTLTDDIDGESSSCVTWYTLNPEIADALNPKGISGISDVDADGCITITVDNTD